jgi:hypothetical protein
MASSFSSLLAERVRSGYQVRGSLPQVAVQARASGTNDFCTSEIKRRCQKTTARIKPSF